MHVLFYCLLYKHRANACRLGRTKPLLREPYKDPRLGNLAREAQDFDPQLLDGLSHSVTGAMFTRGRLIGWGKFFHHA